MQLPRSYPQHRQHRNCDEWTLRIANLRIGNLLAILRLAINRASVAPKIVNIVKIPPAKLELLPLRNCPRPRVGLSERRRACLRLKFSSLSSSSPSSSSLSPLNGRSRRWWWCRRWRADWPAHDVDNVDIGDDNVYVLLIMTIMLILVILMLLFTTSFSSFQAPRQGCLQNYTWKKELFPFLRKQAWKLVARCRFVFVTLCNTLLYSVTLCNTLYHAVTLCDTL